MNRSDERSHAVTTPQLWSAVAGGGGVFVVLVHGSLDRSAGLLKLSRRLDERYVVARYDRRGYGRSQPHPGPFGIDGQVDDLVEVIRRHAPGPDVPCIVVGHSYGGNVALAAVDRHPGLIDAVVTYETPLSWLSWWAGGAGSDAVAWQEDPAEAAERFMRRLIGDERWARLPASTRAARRSEGPAMVGELIDLRSGAPWQPERIDVPVRCLYGEHGRSHHQRGAEHLAEMLPDATAIRIDGAHHFGPNTHPDDVGACIIEFIDRVTR
jgi:pimeloyl-ACP methyl ester carboxylesterase